MNFKFGAREKGGVNRLSKFRISKFGVSSGRFSVSFEDNFKKNDLKQEKNNLL